MRLPPNIYDGEDTVPMKLAAEKCFGFIGYFYVAGDAVSVLIAQIYFIKKVIAASAAKKSRQASPMEVLNSQLGYL